MTAETFFVGLGALIVFGGAMWAAVKAAFITSLFFHVLINTLFGRFKNEAQQHVVYVQRPNPHPQFGQVVDAEVVQPQGLPRYERVEW